MKRRIKRLWIKALKSGEYKQMQGRLHAGTKGRCCLGVLCDIHAKETRKSWQNDDYLGLTFYLPSEVLRWAGLPEEDSDGASNNCVRIKPISDSAACSLAALNDDSGYDFKQIAAVIGKQF